MTNMISLLLMLLSADVPVADGLLPRPNIRVNATIPPEAYGIFENTNDPSFYKVLLVDSKQVSVTITLTINGRRMPNPLTCRSRTLQDITPSMRLDLTCKGERIPYRMTYREPSHTWVVIEDDAAPEVYIRRK